MVTSCWERKATVSFTVENRKLSSSPPASHPVPVEAEAQAVQLLPHGLDVAARKTQSSAMSSYAATMSANRHQMGRETNLLVHSSGSRPLSMAAFSAGSPKASQPIGFSTCGCIETSSGISQARPVCLWSTGSTEAQECIKEVDRTFEVN